MEQEKNGAGKQKEKLDSELLERELFHKKEVLGFGGFFLSFSSQKINSSVIQH